MVDQNKTEQEIGLKIPSIIQLKTCQFKLKTW